MQVLETEARKLSLPPSKIMLSEKGAVISGMTPAQFALLAAHGDVIVMGSENSDVRLNEWCFAERASLWLTGRFGAWSGNPIGDHIATNRISEWSAMRNGHMVLRVLLSTYALGATVFRSDSTIPYENPLFLRGDTRDPAMKLANGYRQGVVPFLQLVEAGVFPASPAPRQIQGISPLAIALPEPNAVRMQRQSLNQ